jgi:DNA-binding response OmpR family regulator
MSKKILIIDDEENIIELLNINLSLRGYDVISAETGEKGLELALKEKPSIILLDIKLPGIDGWEVFKRFQSKSNTKDTQIFFLTAAVQKKDRAQAQTLGARFIPKPFDIEDLLNTIHNA